MAVSSVTNDLQSPIEVKLQSEDWKVVYPQKSCDVCASDGDVSFVEVRLRESPEVKGSYQASGGSSALSRFPSSTLVKVCLKGFYKGSLKGSTRDL